MGEAAGPWRKLAGAGAAVQGGRLIPGGQMRFSDNRSRPSFRTARGGKSPPTVLIKLVPQETRAEGAREALIQAIVELKSRNPRLVVRGLRASSRTRLEWISTRTSSTACCRNTIGPPRAEPGPRGCRSSDTRQTACGAWTSFDASPSCSRATGSSSSWTNSRVASSVSACTAARSRAPTFAACSTPPFMVRSHRDISGTDHDPLFEAHRWTANLRILEIDEIKTVPHVPRSHPFVER